jgi:hypothetical protein
VGSGDILAEAERELRLKRVALPDERARVRVRFLLPTLFRPVRSSFPTRIAERNIQKLGFELDAAFFLLGRNT